MTDLDSVMNTRAFANRYPDLVSFEQLRWQIHRRDKNGLGNAGAVVKQAGRWFVDVPRYRDWLMSGER